MLPATCPSADQLRCYLLGTLPGGEDAAVVAHLAVCEACNETLAEHDEATDPLVDHLRRPPDNVTPPDGYSIAVQRMQRAAPVMSTSGAAEAATRTPRRLRDYLLLEKLGEGGMGTVWKARHDHLDKLVALKLLSARRLADADAVARFQREMKAVGRLEHPNLVRATDAGQHEGTHFLAMEYLDGQDAGKLVARLGQLPIADACEIVRQAAVGLQYVHESGMVHRDIKPSNLMVTPEGQVKILDLGLARLGDLPRGDREELTSARQILGTVAYMAPEQADDGRLVDARADVYALGATLLKLLSGEGPRTRMAQGSTSAGLGQSNDVPASLGLLVERMLAADPAERPQTAAEVAEELTPWATGHDLSALVVQSVDERQDEDRNPIVEPHFDMPPWRTGRRYGRWIAAAVCGLVATCVVIVIVIQSRSQQGSAGGEDTPPGAHGAATPLVVPPVEPPTDFALSFDGHNDFVRIPSLSMKGLEQATVECYLRPRRDPQFRESLITGDLPVAIGTRTRERGDQLIVAYGRSAEGQTLRKFRMCEWDKRIHVAVVWDGQRIRLFVEGDEVPSSREETLTELLPLAHGMTLGVDVWGRGPENPIYSHYTGEVDELRISSVARYDRDFVPPARFEPDDETVALYHFDEGKGSRLRDDSGNGHHGVIRGATWVRAWRESEKRTEVDARPPNRSS